MISEIVRPSVFPVVLESSILISKLLSACRDFPFTPYVEITFEAFRQITAWPCQLHTLPAMWARTINKLAQVGTISLHCPWISEAPRSVYVPDHRVIMIIDAPTSESLCLKTIGSRHLSSYHRCLCQKPKDLAVPSRTTKSALVLPWKPRIILQRVRWTPGKS